MSWASQGNNFYNVAGAAGGVPMAGGGGGGQRFGSGGGPVSNVVERENPTGVFHKPWLNASLDIIKNNCDLVLPGQFGKWMMFFSKHNGDLTRMWQQACDLYESGQLVGITNMKVSTNAENPGKTQNTSGVIMFYCGPSHDNQRVMSYGRNLLRLIPYKQAQMTYKSDSQIQGQTRGQPQPGPNHTYKIRIRPDGSPMD